MPYRIVLLLLAQELTISIVLGDHITGVVYIKLSARENTAVVIKKSPLRIEKSYLCPEVMCF